MRWTHQMQRLAIHDLVAGLSSSQPLFPCPDSVEARLCRVSDGDSPPIDELRSALLLFQRG